MHLCTPILVDAHDVEPRVWLFRGPCELDLGQADQRKRQRERAPAPHLFLLKCPIQALIPNVAKSVESDTRGTLLEQDRIDGNLINATRLAKVVGESAHPQEVQRAQIPVLRTQE